MSFTLATLKSTVQDWMQVDETTFNDNLDEMIQNAESRIFKLVQFPQQRKNVTANVSTNNRFLATPSDFYAPFSLAVIDTNEYHYLLYKHPSFIKQYAPNSTTRGRPKYYSLFDDTAFELGPVPDADYDVELHYLYKPASLTSGGDAGTTLLSTEYPELLLYATLVEAAVFLKEPDNVLAQLDARFKEAIARVKNLNEGRATRDEVRYDMLRTGVS
tara:strand:+ start:4361 stop:5008 length:648 start_codon:yes stop_codon:yes gene_type:complete